MQNSKANADSIGIDLVHAKGSYVKNIAFEGCRIDVRLTGFQARYVITPFLPFSSQFTRSSLFFSTTLPSYLWPV